MLKSALGVVMTTILGCTLPNTIETASSSTSEVKCSILEMIIKYGSKHEKTLLIVKETNIVINY